MYYVRARLYWVYISLLILKKTRIADLIYLMYTEGNGSQKFIMYYYLLIFVILNKDLYIAVYLIVTNIYCRIKKSYISV